MTYANQLERFVKTRQDIDPAFVYSGLSGPGSLIVRRHNLTRLDRWFRRRDPIDVYRGYGGDKLRQSLTALQPEIVHFLGHWPAGSIEKRFPELPFTVALDATRPGVERMQGRSLWSDSARDRERELLARAARIYPMSEWAASSLCEDYGISRNKIRVLLPSMPIPEQTLSVPAARPNKLRILFIGNDFRRKGGPRLVSWLRGPLAQNCELHIVSADPAAKIDEPNITSYGRVDNDQLTREILPRMDVLCLPTFSDMSSWAVIEAAVAGVPAVGSRIGGLAELIEHGVTGLALAVDDDAAFVGSLSLMANDPGILAAMRNRLFARTRYLFDGEKNYTLLIEELLSLASGAPLPVPVSR
jgi:glycosyltransferase involved in cell wall biosynthesis